MVVRVFWPQDRDEFRRCERETHGVATDCTGYVSLLTLASIKHSLGTMSGGDIRRHSGELKCFDLAFFPAVYRVFKLLLSHVGALLLCSASRLAAALVPSPGCVPTRPPSESRPRPRLSRTL